MLHPSERAQAYQDAAPSLVARPGSHDEAAAIQAIDEARADERYELEDTPRDRRRRHAKIWRGRMSRHEW